MVLLLLADARLVAETRVRVTGLEGRSEYQVLEMLGGRLEHVKASPASAPLADDAAYMLRRLLRNDGYADVCVDWRIAHAGEIVLSVKEGRRLSLGKVTVEGVDKETARRLARLYSVPAMRGRAYGLGAPPFREEDEDEGLANIVGDFNSRGHWAARAEIVSRRKAENGGVELGIRVDSGERHRIGRAVVTSADGRGVELVEGAVGEFAGKTATTAHLNEMRRAAEELVASRGYPNAAIRMERRLEGNEFIPGFQVDLGGRVRLKEIAIEGAKLTREERIRSRLEGMEGDWYDETAMNRRLREFLSTGAFQSARVEVEPAGDGLVDATLHFEEAMAREVSLAAGYGSYQGFVGRATYSNRNLWGRLCGLTSGIELSYRGVLGDVRVTDPWWGESDVAATARAYAMFFSREGYDVYESGFEGWLSREVSDSYSVEVLLGTSFANLTGSGLPDSALGETVYAHPRLRITQTLDHRDNPVLPKRGWHVENPVQIGAAVGELSTGYVMTGVSGGWFGGLGRHYDLGIGGSCRVLIPSDDGGDLPIDLRMFEGGARSVRSFPERELGPSVAGYPTGGEFAWNANIELIRSIGGIVRAVGFVDAGGLSRQYEDIGSTDVELATGMGLRLDLPIGPVRIEYGYNLTRDPGEPRGTLHFAVGSAF